MKKRFSLVFAFTSLVLCGFSLLTSGLLPPTKSVIYHSTMDEVVTISLSNTNSCTSVISCGQYQTMEIFYGGGMTKVPVAINGQPFFLDSVQLGDGDNGHTNQRVLTVRTYGNDIYGWSNGEVEYQIQ